MAFMSAFRGTDLSSNYKNIYEEYKKLDNSDWFVNAVFKPNNPDLIKYFNSRGIDTEILKRYTKQFHFQIGDKFSFGIGFKNITGGYDIRNSIGKMKIGGSNFSQIGDGNKIAVFEGMIDMLSFLQELEPEKVNEYKCICLNSVVNVDKFIELHQDFKGEIEIFLDAGKPADTATSKILTYFKDQAKDMRELLNINETEQGYKDLNDLLLDIRNAERNIPKENLKDFKEIRPEHTKRGGFKL
jgi:hypothetical protein